MPRLYGRHAKVLWTPGSGGESFRRSSTVILDALALRESWAIFKTDVRRLGSPDGATASMGRAGSFLLRLDVRTDATFQLPSHVPATVRIYDSKHVAAYRYGLALISRANLEAEAESPGRVQRQWYTAEWTGSVSSDTEDAPTLLTAQISGGNLVLTFSAAVARGSAAIGGVAYIDSAGDINTAVNEPSIVGAVVTITPFESTPGSFTPINTVDIAASVFCSAAYPDDPAMVVAAVSDFAIT